MDVRRLNVSVPTPDGTCPASLHLPEGEGPWPAVVLFTDAGGARETFREMADHVATLGYVGFLPDPYYRTPYEPFDMATVFADEGERTRLFSLIGSVSPAMAVSDIGAYLDFLDGHPLVSDGKVGTTGYCMGGSFSFRAAGHFPERVAAAASFHGGRLVTDSPDSPHLLAGSITARVYVAGAENDASYTPEQSETLRTALAAAGVEHTVEFYPALHGFAVPDVPTHDAAAEARHWEALESLYGATLG